MIGATHDLDLLLGHEPCHAIDVVGVLAVEPFCERSARVQAEPDAGMPLEQIQQREITIAVGLFDHLVEVADGLMIVEDEDEANGSRHEWARTGSEWMKSDRLSALAGAAPNALTVVTAGKCGPAPGFAGESSGLHAEHAGYTRNRRR